MAAELPTAKSQLHSPYASFAVVCLQPSKRNSRMLTVDNLPKESVFNKFSRDDKSSVRSETILISNSIIFSSLSPDSHSLFLFLTKNRWLMYTICWHHRLLSTPAGAVIKRAPDLVWYSLYSLFGPLCFVLFFKFCLHPSGFGSFFSFELRGPYI